MKAKSKFKTIFLALPLLLVVCFAGYTPPAQAIAIFDAEINATLTMNLVPGLQLFVGFGDPIIPIENDPDGAGPSFANAGGILTIAGTNDGFTANAFANGSASPTPAPAVADSLASVSGTIVNFVGEAIETTGTVTGDFFLNAAVADPLESATAGVLLDFSFLTDPLISQTLTVPAGSNLTDTLTVDPFNFDIIIPAFASVVFTFEARAFGSATGVVENLPAPVPEPATIILLSTAFVCLAGLYRKKSKA